MTDQDQEEVVDSTKTPSESSEPGGGFPASDGWKYECQYCCRKFGNLQALGRHKNAHKIERQRAKQTLMQASRNAPVSYMRKPIISACAPKTHLLAPAVVPAAAAPFPSSVYVPRAAPPFHGSHGRMFPASTSGRGSVGSLAPAAPRNQFVISKRGKEMDSSSTQTMSQLFEQMIEWRWNKTRNEDPVKFNWTHVHLSILHNYVLKLGLNSDFRSPILSASTVASFEPELQEFFVVPKQLQLFHRDDNLKRHELMAVFINLLLRLLHHREGSIISLEDRIKSLEKELRFLLTVVGDKSLICDGEHEQIQNLLAEIEAAANEAGNLVHSVVFSTYADRIFGEMDERPGVLKHVDLLKANIIEFSELQTVIIETNITTKADDVNSPFIVDSVLYDLEDLLNREDDIISDVKDQIKELQQQLKRSKSFIKVSRHPEMEELKEHVMRIEDTAYEAEYLINSFLVGDAPRWYFSIRLSHVILKIKLIETRIQETKKKYDNVDTKVAENLSKELSSQNKKSSAVDDIIVGFEDKAMDILDHLVGVNEHLQIISIFGMPGLGKTTLAKKLYNHPLVKYNFDKCSWCVVSQTYRRKNILIDITVSLESELDKVEILKMEDEMLMEHIYKSLKGRRYLIVMDDVWSSNTWYDLQRCFPDDQIKSRILFTSRNKHVAPPNSIIYELPSMSDELCWELLKKKVFQNEPCPPGLLKTGKRIAANCRGVPLGAVVMAGVLSSMDKERGTWENVEGNFASHIFSGQNNSMMQILELSYKYLQDHLKPCFLYFGAFPEDTKIPVRKLMRLWIAEGFIIREDKKNLESSAEKYLMELIDKSLVMVAERRFNGGVKSCVVHDLLRDLCLKRCKEECFLKYVDKNYSIYEKHHRLCVRSSEAASRISPLYGLHVRSLFGSLHKSSILNMKLLRVLDLLSTDENDNLSEIDLLVHLRYLALEYVPSSTGRLAVIGNLVNLEFLVVKTYDSVFIPSVMVKMKKLRYVKFTSLVYFDEDCDNSETNSLEFLSHVSIRSLKDEEMLKCSPHLRKLSCNCKALWEEEKGGYRYTDFRFFSQLESLRMKVGHGDRRADTISLPSSIKKLTLSGLRLPWENMSIIGGLPNLQVLELLDDAFVGEVWETRDGEFQQLTFLKLYFLKLEQWNVTLSEHFPRFQQLVLSSCKFLQEIPLVIGEIAMLQLIEIRGMCRESLVESAREIEREQLDNGNEELRVHLHGCS